jgi:ABC-2 type transport system permease protein
MKKVLLIARWEFLATVTRRTYILAVLGLPVLLLLLAVAMGLSGRSMLRGPQQGVIALVDPSGIVDLEFAGELDPPRSTAATSIVRYDTLDLALADLNAMKVSVVFELDPDYMTNGRVRGFGLQTDGRFGQALGGQRQALVSSAIRASLLRDRVHGDALRRLYNPLEHFESRTLGADGTMRPPGGTAAIRAVVGSLTVVMLLTMAIFFSAGFLQQATIEDRQNRVIEVLLASTTPDQLLMGKIVGLGAAGLLQLAIYVGLVILPSAIFTESFRVPLQSLALSLVYFVTGYLLYAALIGGAGMIGRTPQASAQLTAIWTFIAASPMFFLPTIIAAPDGLFSRTLSFFPMTSPAAMILRLTSGRVPLTDILVSTAIGVLSVVVALRVASRIFRTASLMYGKRPTFHEVVRWLRTASN